MGETTQMTTPATQTFADFKSLTDTEDYLQFFGISYDQTFVNVNRLHILKQFSLLIEEVDQAFPDLSETEKLSKYGEAFAEAYELFKTSSPVETKLFKVFQEKPKDVVFLKDLTKDAGVK
ncbi:nitrogenase-stabilizing/protective protein NifW [Gloeothece verrucosa]|uniref:Nitrogenase-stabilizing/protective protein NifW n=1 Tax=Gloeothece verrucosa (strain PCC 7822) TaxID=497965 RepID=E0UH22_GLOV7|nr:nitrogenase-stabilizing/protective protein NifW [Gloeothece verrucosa]ADN15621.1 nitrogen fixation protein NifW [Gloeothece verrucosa PCC 7822]